jgi:hypothetical protein
MFSISPASCKGQSAVFDDAQSKLRNYSAEIENLRGEISFGIRTTAAIDACLQACADNTLRRSVETQQLGTKLVVVCNTYENTEEKIVGNILKPAAFSASRAGSNGGEGSSNPNPPAAFDDNGQYGGNQGSPMLARGDKRDDLYEIVRKYYPDMTDEEIADYLKKLNDEGCGYVAICNTIFAEFDGQEERFEEIFGFPMYDENGELNYDMLVTDLYAATDNHNQSGVWFWASDSVDPNEDASATDGWGTNEKSRKYRTELYLKDKGIDVKIDNSIKVTADNFSNYSDGHVIMRGDHFELIPVNGGDPVKVDEGHAMTVTGVTEDGLLIVSSWGQQYYIDPNATGCSYDYAYYEYDIKEKK